MLEGTSSEVRLRPAAPDDCRRIWEWRNEQSTREASFNKDPIPFEEHERWFGQKMTDPLTRIFVVLNRDGQEIGYLRFDITGDEAEISISIDRTQRGKGYGIAAIKIGSDQILATEPVRRIVARILRGNDASIAAFQQSGFVLRGYNQTVGVDACELTYEGSSDTSPGPRDATHSH